MTDNRDTSDEIPPVPTLELWKLVKHFPVPDAHDGKYDPWAEELREAHATVYDWLRRAELELGLPSFASSRDLSEFDEVRRRQGLCPKCRKSDGYLWLMDQKEFWAYCDQHRTRWKVDPRGITDGFVPDGSERWDDEEHTVSTYWVVSPFRIAGPEIEDALPDLPLSADRDDPDGDEPRPKLRIVRPEQITAEPAEMSSSEEGTVREVIGQVLRLLFVEVPHFYLREIRLSLSDLISEPRLRRGRG